MTRSRRAVLALVTVLVLTLASRTDPGMRLVADLLGPRVSLYLGGQSTLQGVGAQVAEQHPAEAAQPPDPPAGTAALLASAVTVEASAKVEQGYLVETRLLTKDAKPMNDTIVSFYDVVDLLGRREMLVGTAVTDGQGHATLKYLPPEAGHREIITRSAAHGQFAATEGRATFQATVVAPPSYSRELLPLASFTPSLPFVAGAALLAIWALFALALIRTGRRIAVAGARLATPPIGPASGGAARARLATPTQRKIREDLG